MPDYAQLRVLHIGCAALSIALAVQIGQYPLAQDWLTAKVLALVVYVLAGIVALRPGTTPVRRGVAPAIALAAVSWIMLSATTRHAIPFL